MQEPAKLLVEYTHLFPAGGKILDVAMGRGRNAVYLARRGFHVTGLEIDREAIKVCEEIALKEHLPVEIRQVDLEDLSSYEIETSYYDGIICFFYLQRNLFPRLKDALKPGGLIIYETFLIDNHIKFGHPRHREYCFNHNELLHLFIDFRILFYREGPNPKGTFCASLVARKRI